MDLESPALKRIQFVRHKVAHHRRHYVTEDDVKIVLSRLPEELWTRLRKVHFKDDAKGNRRLGYTTTRGRREISLCALPIRVSLNRAGNVAELFGAMRGSQWPVLAVRRYMLYDVLLHELGHLQIILPAVSNPNRKFASETKAQKFANEWRRKLWSKHFDHPDVVHNAPGPKELSALKAGWVASNLAYKCGLELHKAKKWSEAFAYCQQAIELYPNHAKALELSARLYGLTQKPLDLARQHDYLRRALAADPLLYNANLWLAINLAELGRREEARQAFQRAIRIIPLPDIAATAFASALSEWGFNQEADSLFKKLIARKSLDPAVLSSYAWHLMRRHDEPTTTELHQAAELLRKAVKMEPRNWLHHYSLAVALLDFESEREEAIRHARAAINLKPESKQAHRVLAELTEASA